MLVIEQILCRAGTMNNYAYLITDQKTNISAIIDPSEAAPIIAICEQKQIHPQYIFNTHHHFDHTDGNLELKEKYHCTVIGNIKDSARIPGFDIGVKDGETFMLGETQAQIIDVSAHTQGHILWYFAKDKIVFTGDTLFNLCVGGLFEGSVEEMYQALQKIKSLPEDTLFYPGHEYTLYGAAEALKFLPDEPLLKEYIKEAQIKLSQGKSVSPISLRLEKICNPYLRAQNLTELQQII